MERMNPLTERDTGSNDEVIKDRLQKKGRNRGRRTAVDGKQLKLSPPKKEKLKQLLEDYGAQILKNQAEQLEGQSGSNENKGVFTKEEEQRLVALHEIFGNKWPSRVANLFPGRTHKAVERQLQVIMTRKRIQQETRGIKRKRGVDGRGTECRAWEKITGCRSTRAKSGATADTNEQFNVNTDLSQGSIFSQGHDQSINMGVPTNTSMSTGTKYCTSSNTMREASASELQRNHEEREVTAPSIDFMGLGSVEGQVAGPFIDFMGVGSTHLI